MLLTKFFGSFFIAKVVEWPRPFVDAFNGVGVSMTLLMSQLDRYIEYITDEMHGVMLLAQRKGDGLLFSHQLE